jgi:protocatechuate 3,4-dioxygenase beta subunit
VRVTISGPAQPSSSVLTDSEGRYAFTVLAPATYDLEAELPGFETLHRRIRVTEPVSIELQLALTGSGSL